MNSAPKSQAGEILGRFEPTVEPESAEVKGAIEKALRA